MLGVDVCSFNLKGELILYSYRYKIIYIYSTQTKYNNWKCKRKYEIPEGLNLINISKYNEFYLHSNKSIYEWDPITEKNIKLLSTDEETNYHKVIR